MAFRGVYFMFMINLGPFSVVTSPKAGIYQTTMGGVVLQVLSGDITKETTDVIVNSSNDNFTLKSGNSGNAWNPIVAKYRLLTGENEIIVTAVTPQCICIIKINLPDAQLITDL